MSVYFYKLIPPRRTFPQDITPDEVGIMQRHVAYWNRLAESGRVVVFGPVADPNGAYGVAIVESETEEEARGLGNDDPAVTANAGFTFDVYEMPRAVVPGSGTRSRTP